MSMTLKCPRCSYSYDAREGTRNADLIEIIRLQSEFAPHGKLVFEYAELFETTRPLKAAKLLRVLKEVQALWTSGRFEFQKRVYTISKDGMAAAIKTVCSKRFDIPLENHNYLKKVMITIAEQEAQKRSAETERASRQKEANLRAGIRPGEVRSKDDDIGPAAMPETLKKMLGRFE